LSAQAPQHEEEEEEGTGHVGLKTWATGELVTAPLLNAEFRDQVVSQFATVAARNSAVTSPVAGQMCWTQAEQCLWQYSTNAPAGWRLVDHGFVAPPAGILPTWTCNAIPGGITPTQRLTSRHTFEVWFTGSATTTLAANQRIEFVSSFATGNVVGHSVGSYWYQDPSAGLTYAGAIYAFSATQFWLIIGGPNGTNTVGSGAGHTPIAVNDSFGIHMSLIRPA
jgi:hypothetical protein